MRLLAIFLIVLTVSAIVTSMAAWGITYGTSSSRVAAMAADYSAAADDTLARFVAFVNQILQGDAQLVTGILARNGASGSARSSEAQASTTRTIGALVNYTASNTVEFEKQMQEVATTFAVVVGGVVADFKGLAGDYAAVVRQKTAEKAAAAFSVITAIGQSNFMHLQRLLNLGLISLAQNPTDPVGQADCTILSLLCSMATDAPQDNLTVVSATGRLYSCGPFQGATVSQVVSNGSLSTESYLTWLPNSSHVVSNQQNWVKQRCLSEAPAVRVVPRGCLPSADCRCGADPRCTAWGRLAFRNASYSSVAVFQNQYDIPALHISTALANLSAEPPTVQGVFDASISLGVFDGFLAEASFLNFTRLALVLNDSNLTMFGSTIPKCGGNVTPPGDARYPPWSVVRACDAGLRAVAAWLAGNRSLAWPAAVEAAGIVWDVVPLQRGPLAYFFIVGMNNSAVNGAIDAAGVRATEQLAAVGALLSDRVAAGGAATRAYVAELAAQDIQGIQLIQNAFLADLQVLENTSLASLSASQQTTTVRLQMGTNTQRAAFAAAQAKHLSAMTVTAGWTIAVVAAILLLVLLAGAWGTTRVTRLLTQLIDLIEDVADLRVEHLHVPQNSSVAEVARLQAAFQVLVHRLVEYKGYIPAGVFERGRAEPETVTNCGGGEVSEGGQRPQTLSDAEGGHSGPFPRSGSRPPAHNPDAGSSDALVHPPRSSAGSAGTLSPVRRIMRRVTVLSINVTGFMDVLVPLNDESCITLLNDYVSCVHEAVSQSRGSVDSVLADQVTVTFNAHLPCGDSAAAAAAAALEVQRQLLLKVGAVLKFQIGLSHGQVLASSVGYSKFKTMVTVGGPMRIASLLSHLPRFQTSTILIDSSLEERLKYMHILRPVDMVYLPDAKSFSKGFPTSLRIFSVLGRKVLEEVEWLYQVGAGAASDWTQTFDQLVAAVEPHDRELLLQKYLANHPGDEVAQRLRDRLARWVPGRGIPL